MKKAFTLIELLVGVAIAALLIAILLPSLSSTRKQAQDNATAAGSIATESNENDTYGFLPLTATNIIQHGNEWYEFTLNERQWMYHSEFRYKGSFVPVPRNLD